MLTLCITFNPRLLVICAQRYMYAHRRNYKHGHNNIYNRKKQRSLKGPPTEERVHELWQIHSMDCCVVV